MNSFSHNEQNFGSSFYKSRKMLHIIQNSDLNDFSSLGNREAAKSVIARQESEILRLAEESQHVIISQLANKIVHQSSIPEEGEENTLNSNRFIY
jgi:hypothetical protein